MFSGCLFVCECVHVCPSTAYFRFLAVDFCFFSDLSLFGCVCVLGSWHTHTHPFNGPFSGTTRVSRYQKGKTNLDFTEARDNEWQWHQLGHMQVCISLQTDNHASTPPLSFFTGRMPFLPPNQQRHSTESILGSWLSTKMT